MKRGDRVVVIGQPDDEWYGCAGEIRSLRSDGFVGVVIDGVGWEVFFWPHDIELESIVKGAEG